MAELKVDAFPGRFGRHTDLRRSPELLLRLLPLVGIHAAMDLADGIAPGFEVFLEMLQRVPMFGEDEQLAASVVKLLKFSFGQALLQCR